MALSKISGTTGIADATITSAKLADFTAAVDLNGVELLLDADADTSISADTDDQIDIKIANADHLKILSSSGDTVFKPMVDAKDIIFQQFDGNKIFCIDDGNFVSVGGNATAAGQIRIYEDTDNGSHYSGFTVGNLTASVAYQLPNADGSSGQQLTTDGSGVLSWAVGGTNPPSADGDSLGTASLEWSDLFLADGSTIQFGNDQDVTLTHVADTGLLLSATDQLQFGDSGTFIHQSADGVLDLVSDTEIEINATTIDINGNVEISGTATTTGVHTFTATPVFSSDITLSDDLNLTSDGAIVTFGTDSEVTLTHVHNTGILLNSTNVIQFNDASQNIGAPSNAILDINATDEIELNATLVDVNANLDVSGTITSGGVITGTAFTAGSAVLAEAELELLDGLTAGTAIASKVVTTDANIDTTGQRNLTISGEIDAATGDFSGAIDVAGTANLDVVDIDGAVDMASTLQVDGVITTSDGMIITTADNTDTLTLVSTDTDAGIAPTLNLSRNNNSAAANDFIGKINFTAEDAANNQTSYANIQGVVLDATDGSEDGRLRITSVVDGTNINRLDFLAGETVFNEDSIDLDFRVESNGNANMLFVDGGNDRIAIGTTNVSSTAPLSISSGFAKTDTSSRAVLNLQSNEASGQSQLRVMNIGHASNQPNRKWQLQTSEAGVSNGGQLELQVDGGSVQMGATGGGLLFVGADDIVVNEGSTDTNFRVESNGNTNMIFVDGGSDHVNIGTATDLGGVLNVNGKTVITTADNTDTLTLTSTDTDAAAGPNLHLYRNQGTDEGDDDVLGQIKFSGRNDNAQDVLFYRQDVQSSDVSDGAEDAQVRHLLMVAGSETEFLRMNPTGFVFNEGSADLDFRIESNGDANCFFIDANNNNIILGNNSGDGLGGKLQVVATDTSAAIAVHRASADSAGAQIFLSSSRAASISDDTVVQDGDTLGSIVAFGADGTDRSSPAGSISFQVDGTPGGNDMPGRIIFKTTSDGGVTQTERMRINAVGAVKHASGGDDLQGTLTNQIHNFSSAANLTVLEVSSGDANFSNSVVGVGAKRGASNQYSLITASTGNGSNDRFNDLEFKVKGDGNVSCDESFAGSGADYSEYFEWNDGNSSDVDRVGISVKLNGNKIVASAGSDDAADIIGVVSGSPVIIGDADGTGTRWTEKYEKDDYGRAVYETYTITTWTEVVEDGDDIKHEYHTDRIPSGTTAPTDATAENKLTVISKEDDNTTDITRRKLNSSWDATATYIARADRKEWDTVGLVGKLRMKKNQRTGTNWIKLRDISDTVEEWLVR